MRIPKFFDKNIEHNCRYCRYCRVDDEDVIVCTLSKTMEKDTCPEFFYDPLMREPKTAPELNNVDPEEFEL